jgi:endoglucanase
MTSARALRLLALVLAASGLAACAAGTAATAPASTPATATAYPAPDGMIEPYAQARALGKGVNFGNLLDASPDEGAWTGGQRIQPTDFDQARAAGFDSVRLPVRFSAHAATTAPYTIDPAFLARVDEVVRWGLSRELKVVLVFHHYEEIHKDPAAHRERFLAIWRQLAAHYEDQPCGLYYELLNEPSQQLTVPRWNALLAEALRAIREVDRHHTVVVGCTDWSNPGGLEGLELPAAETNAIVTFHYYTPHLFTFQGKAWMGPNWRTTGITWPGPPATPVAPADGVEPWVKDWIQRYNTLPAAHNPAGEAWVRDELARAAAWGKAHGRPLWMSEFTAQDGAALESRARWLAFVRTELERLGIPWSMWSLNSDASSRLYDPAARRWNEALTRALGLSVTNG